MRQLPFTLLLVYWATGHALIAAEWTRKFLLHLRCRRWYGGHDWRTTTDGVECRRCMTGVNACLRGEPR